MNRTKWFFSLLLTAGLFSCHLAGATVVPPPPPPPPDDTTPPEVNCIEGVNPSGKTIPKAGGKNGQNEDGFYELIAEDDVDPDVEIFVRDMKSGTVFGPFANGTTIKYTEAPGAAPNKKKIGNENNANAVSWHITGNGDAEVYAVDFSGNESDPVSCLVPPSPK